MKKIIKGEKKKKKVNINNHKRGCARAQSGLHD